MTITGLSAILDDAILGRPTMLGNDCSAMADDPVHGYYDGPNQFRSERLRRLYAYWDSARGDRLFPPMAAIDPAALRDFLPDILVIDVTNQEEPRYRLVGTGYREFFNRDFTGVLVAEAGFPESEFIARRQSAAAKDGKPRLGWYQWLSASGVDYQVETILLPFGEAGIVKRLLGMEDLDQARGHKL
jgi:hypothetical protein